ETVIGHHYAEQVEEVRDREPELAAQFAQFRDEELEHLDTAVAEGAREAPGYRVLSAVIQAGCRAAIRITEKV
ncbi:MAG: demethoxyubiquinone hydroxylase family protein, partial [Proteobacteria bacterium]|nr:demethoxyubiquinone hydroxylase family protein [Pseudomonadota bacterium]